MLDAVLVLIGFTAILVVCALFLGVAVGTAIVVFNLAIEWSEDRSDRKERERRNHR